MIDAIGLSNESKISQQADISKFRRSLSVVICIIVHVNLCLKSVYILKCANKKCIIFKTLEIF